MCVCVLADMFMHFKSIYVNATFLKTEPEIVNIFFMLPFFSLFISRQNQFFYGFL